MRKEQWFVIGTAFMILAVWFILMDYGFERVCGRAGYPPHHYSEEEWQEAGSEPVSRIDLWCINTEIYDPFILTFSAIWIICLVNAGLEWWAEKKKE